MFALLPLYIVAFVVMFALFRWYMLLPGVALAILFEWWLFRGLEGANGATAFGVLMIAGPSILGFASGFVARFIVIVVPPVSRSPIKQMAVAAICLVAAPAMAFALSQYQEVARKARYAPPSAECLTGAHRAQLGNFPIAFPLAPGVAVDAGRGADNRASYFAIPEHARTYCAAKVSPAPVITAIHIDFGRAEPDSPYCREPRRADPDPRLCSRWMGAKAGRVAEETFYRFGQYDAGKMLAFSGDADREIGWFARKQKPRQVGPGLIAYDSGGHDALYVLNAPKPDQRVVARCFPSTVAEVTKEEAIYCSGGSQIARDIGVVFEFGANRRTIEADMNRAFSEVQASWRKLSTSAR